MIYNKVKCEAITVNTESGICLVLQKLNVVKSLSCLS
jgi:hypothetical protein